MISVGDKVLFLREKGGGEVLKITGQKILLCDDDGFERWVLVSELTEKFTKTKGVQPLEETPIKIEIPSEVSNRQKRKLERSIILEPKKTGTKKPLSIREIDLHIHELVPSTSGLSNYEIVQIQLNSFKKGIQKAQIDKVNKLIVIHGKGQGVLKNEICEFLRKQAKLSFKDANFRKYGNGATEITFHPNYK